MQLYFVIYVSIGSRDLGQEELLEILRVSRENNARDEITGLLLYKERRFLQILEGPEARVCATYGRISNDTRHHEPTILLEGETKQRDFADWSMGFHDLDAETARETPGYSPFLDAKFSVFEFASDPSRAHQLLRIFRRM
jgi:hypothetical protein